MSTSVHPSPSHPLPEPGDGQESGGGSVPAPHILDNPAWASLDGPHARFAERVGRAARYPTDVSPFTALADSTDPRAWDDLVSLVGPDALAPVSGATHLPDGWEAVRRGQGVQLVDTSLRAEPDAEAVRLTRADVPEILDLIARTEPGPFLPRTIELGTYLGIRREGRLVAMAGERLHPPGWREISAVCTDAAYRGQGLATRLVRAVAAGIRERGETPFMHAAAANTGAIRLYESIGFTLRRRSAFLLVRTPPGPPRPSAVPKPQPPQAG
ncbi:GNAT family N-acetyltransferase [Streptomyces liangshanensis]|uniref:GNAT family N-acetyltransferase n=1 Tax=Streptomyces liangshanensis TaxID=2717324 RepID=UPI0036DF471E